MWNNMNDLMISFNEFSRNFMSQLNADPKQKVQELLNSGQMSQEQFNQLREKANQLTGKHM